MVECFVFFVFVILCVIGDIVVENLLLNNLNKIVNVIKGFKVFVKFNNNLINKDLVVDKSKINIICGKVLYKIFIM